MASRSARAAHTADEGGFTILESTIALGIVFAVLVGLLSTLTTSVRGIVNGRQRTVAVGLAEEVMELGRGLGYGAVGHDLDDDSTLATDDALVSTGTYSWTYNGEELSGSSIDEDPNSPFYPHRSTETVEGTTFTITAYVTLVEPTAQEHAVHKRITAVVAWGEGAGSGTGGEVRIESFLHNAVEPPDPLLIGLADVDAGVLKVTGTLTGVDLKDAFFWFPYAHGEVESRFIRRIKGFAGSPRTQMNVNNSLSSSEFSGCTVTNSNKTAECRGVKAESVADNDAGTAPSEHDVVGPLSDAGGTVERKGVFAIVMGTGNSALSKSTVNACFSCHSASYPDDDGLPYQQSTADGVDSLSMPYSAQLADGSVATFASESAATATVDRDDSSSGSTISSATQVSHPAIDLLTFSDTVYDSTGANTLAYSGLVRLGATSASATAAAGPGAAAPSVTGSDVTVQLFDTTQSTPGYRSVTFTPGTQKTETTTSEVVVEGYTVTMDATVSTTKSVLRSTVAGSTIYDAAASLTTWLRVISHIKIVKNDGTVVADLTVDLDYGRLLSSSEYDPAT